MTVKGGVFRTRFSSLSALVNRLDRRSYLRIHRYLVVNLNRIVTLDPGIRMVQIEVAVGGTTHSLLVSRRLLARLRDQLGLGRRRR
jgi:DNA-binding LytR/AlgR family response regulator